MKSFNGAMKLPLLLVCSCIIIALIFSGNVSGEIIQTNSLTVPETLVDQESNNTLTDRAFTPAQVAFLNKGAKEIFNNGLLPGVQVLDEDAYITNGKLFVSSDFLDKNLGITYYISREDKQDETSNLKEKNNANIHDNNFVMHISKGQQSFELFRGPEKDLPITQIKNSAYLPLRMVTEPFNISLHFYPKRVVPLVIIDNENILDNKQFNQLVDKEPASIVNIPEKYGYQEMLRDLKTLKVKYPFIKTETIGKSVQGRDLVAVRLGNGPKEVFYSASIHAQEWITGPILMKFIEEYSRAYANGSKFLGYDPGTLFNQTTIYLLPICNPDGVELVLRGISKDDPKYNAVMELNNWNSDFSRWRANINGVDLNLQFPANWDKLIKKKTPSYADYPGPEPLSEPESKSLYDFTLAHDFKLVLSFHSQGQVIFWKYYGMEPPGASNIVRHMSEISGYTPYAPPRTYGGYRDWFIQQYRRPGFTIEVGIGQNPLPVSQFGDIWRKTAPLMLYTASI